MRRRSGFTLLEMLIASGVFFLIMGAVTAGVTLTLRTQNLNEAAAGAQAKVRRVGEVFSQELRSAVLGGISNTPYTSDGDSVSFALLDGGAGFQVLPHAGGNAAFKAADSVQIVAPFDTAGELGLVGSQVLMVNANGEATVFPVSAVQSAGAGTFRFDVVHAGCTNRIDYTSNTLLFEVVTIGYDFDSATGDLDTTIGAAAETTLSFELEAVAFRYVYTLADGTTSTQSTPLTDAGGLPVRTGTISGQAATLARVQLDLDARESTTGGRTVQRTYTTFVELSSNPSLFVRRVDPC